MLDFVVEARRRPLRSNDVLTCDACPSTLIVVEPYEEVPLPQWTFKGRLLECVQGDITRQPDMDAVVNAANAELRIGGGVAGAIHRAAGPELDRACRTLAPISPGDAVLTDAFNLPNRYVIHCLGPVYELDRNPDRLLAACYRNALSLANEHQIESIAFPAISTGAFGYPMAPAAQIAFRTVLATIGETNHVRLVRFVLFAERDLGIHVSAMQTLVGNLSATDDEGLIDEP